MERAGRRDHPGARPYDGSAHWRSVARCACASCAVLLAVIAIVWADGQVRINRYAEQIATSEREIGAMMAALRDLQARDKRQDTINETQKEINLSTAKWMVLASEKINGRQRNNPRPSNPAH